MLNMAEIIKSIRAKNPKVRIMIGGAPVNPEIAERYGADGYAKNAGTAVDEAMRLFPFPSAYVFSFETLGERGIMSIEKRPYIYYRFQ
jgi:hypothetical protein